MWLRCTCIWFTVLLVLLIFPCKVLYVHLQSPVDLSCFREVKEELMDVVRWFNLGIALGLPYPMLKKIEEDNGESRRMHEWHVSWVATGELYHWDWWYSQLAEPGKGTCEPNCRIHGKSTSYSQKSWKVWIGEVTHLVLIFITKWTLLHIILFAQFLSMCIIFVI